MKKRTRVRAAFRCMVMVMTCSLALTLFSQVAMAHTGLESSTPEDGDVITDRLSEISMIFNTEVEPLSNFKLIRSDGNEVEIGQILVNNNRMSGTVENPLQAGDYAVEWKIVGRDGHPIEGSYRFTVRTTEEPATPAEPEEDPLPSVEEPANEPVVDEPAAERSEAVEAEQANDTRTVTANTITTTVVPWLIVAITALALVFIANGMRRRQ
ncbi:copper resistance protein CopC [Paenibacillus sp. 1P07SE]|uniref:copper resistance CopC family protein n=1 Tax=Paenibacillus sp. 1P07SE TaxID=3132209 RepID=UPI0039A62DDD